MEENEASLMQLAYSVSPAICRPLSSAYMSIRHMEDLKKIRPVILFLIENHSELFTLNRFPNLSNTSSGTVSGNVSGKSPLDIVTFDLDKTGVLSDMMASAMVIDSTHKAQMVDQPAKSSDHHAVTEFPFVKPNLLVMIPTGGSAASDTSTSSSVEMEADDKPTTAPASHSYSDSEWKVPFLQISFWLYVFILICYFVSV
jgi:hypothetical protein